MELLSVIRRLKIAGALFIVVMLSGTVGYYSLGEEGTTWLDALYMTGVTISTVGYHEIVSLDTHPYGRLFTLVLIFFGFAVLTYLFSNLIALFIEGDIRSTFTKRRMLKQIQKMNDHYIICGCGRVGRNIAYELMQTEHEFVMADNSKPVYDALHHEIKEPPFIVGDCTDDSFLLSLGIERAKGLFVVSGEDNTNLVICLTARQLNPQVKIVARVKEIINANKMHRVGADRVVSPNYIGGIRMAAEMLRPAAVSFMDELMRSEFDQRLEECVIPAHMDGQPISNFPIHDLDNTSILALREKGVWHYSPNKNHEMKQGEHLVLITTPSERKVLEARIN
jgi:voltage-gated potassium channel